MRAKSLIAILLILLVAIPALGQDAPPWQVRSYLSTYTDTTQAWNYTAVRHRFVCPYCGYSTTVEDPTPADPYVCPNPYGLDKHDPGTPAVYDPADAGYPGERELTEATPRQRVLGHLDVEALPLNGAYPDDLMNPLVGRPFHPGATEEPNWNDAPYPWDNPAPADVASYLTVRAANLGAGSLVTGDGSAASDGLRFLVLKPGSVRPAAQPLYYDETDTPSGPGAPVFHRVLDTTGNATGSADDYLVHINPYRVSDGDVFYIWHYEASDGLTTTGLEVEIYSTLYGKDFDSDPVDTGTDDDNGAILGAHLGNYYGQGSMVVVSDSGALRVEIPRRYNGVVGEGWWVLKVEIESNTTTLPRPHEVNYTDIDPGPDVQDVCAAFDEPVFANPLPQNRTAGTPDWKLSFVHANTTRVPVTLSTADDDDETFPVTVKATVMAPATDEIWPYRMPPEAAGKGRVMLQWSDAEQALTWNAFNLPDGRYAFYNTGREWFYLVDPEFPDERLVTNQDTVEQTPIEDQIAGQVADPIFIDSYFMCSRLDVPLTGDDWAGRNPEIPAETDTEAATGGHTRIILGEYEDPYDVTGATGWVGQYAPGTRTPGRTFALANRTPVRVLQCPVDDDGCGARYPLGMPYPDGDNGVLDPGDLCPACGAATGARLERARAEAQVHYDAQSSFVANVLGNYNYMIPDVFRFSPTGTTVPIGARDFVQEILADIPSYQAPSVPPGSTIFANDIEEDLGYRGMLVAFNRPGDADDALATNTTWDAYYLSPNTGKKFMTPEATDAVGSQAEWVCSICGSTYSRGSGNTCLYCGNELNTTDDLPDPYVPWDSLVAEEYDPFGVQVSVLRQAALAADLRTVDLGWLAPGVAPTGPNTVNTPATIVPGSEAMPSDVSSRQDMPVRNEGNVQTQTEMLSASLLQTGVDRSVRSYTRWGQTVPITLGTLVRFRPGPMVWDGTPWLLNTAEATGAAGETATALLQAGIRSVDMKPVPLGQPVGNYATDVLMFVDLDGSTTFDFYDTETGTTNRPYTEFDPDIDEPYEPVVSFSTRARVVESRLPQSDFYSQDVTPTLLYDAGLENMQVLWVGQRAAPGNPGDAAPAGTGPADVPLPTAPMNILYSNASVNDTILADPLYRGWLWNPPDDVPESASALSVSNTPNESNTAPTAYIDEQNGSRWVMWQRSQTSGAGTQSQLRFDSSGDTDWTGSGPLEYIFGSSGAHAGLTGFVREGVENAHWLLWQAGPSGREDLRYRWEWDPTSGTVPSDERLMVSNSSTGQRLDFFDAAGQRYRKPALNPFTYVKQPTAYGTTNADGEFEMNVLYTGHIRALGNSDICWSRFNFGNPDPAVNPDFPLNGVADNFGKVPFPRVAGPLFGPDSYPRTDSRGMPAVRDVNGDVQGYVGEQLEPSPRRQSFQARDLDWLVTYEYQSALGDSAGPDWYDWFTAGVPTATSYDDPMFYVGVVSDDGTGPEQRVYAVDWSRGSYDRATGLYTVLPRLVQMTEGGLEPLHEPPTDAGPPVWHPHDDAGGNGIYWRVIGDVSAKALLDPSLRGEAVDADAWGAGPSETWPAVMLTINPASGMVQWSKSLFNPDNPADRTAVFNSSNTGNIVDVVMYADYTPFIRRATTDMADDDSPSASYNTGDSGRLTVFWRRSYGDTDTPHFGRPSFMYRTYTRAIQVGRPGIDSVTGIIDRTAYPEGTAGAVDMWADGTAELVSQRNGVIAINPDAETSLAQIGHRIQVNYVDAAGVARSEQHRVIGWSIENPIPINAVTSEGPLRVIPEVYEVDPNTSVTGDEFDTVRYWLTWSSPRGVYDMRAAAGDGQEVHQSSDVYLAVVAPEHSSLIADLEVPRLEP